MNHLAFYSFFLKYHKAHSSGIKQYYDEYACDFEDMFDDLDFIHIMFVQPMLLFWKNKYFKKKLISFSNKNAPNTGSKKINKLFLNAVSEFIEDSSVDSSAFRVNGGITNKLKGMIKKRASQLMKSDDEDLIEFLIRCVLLVNELIN